MCGTNIIYTRGFSSQPPPELAGCCDTPILQTGKSRSELHSVERGDALLVTGKPVLAFSYREAGDTSSLHWVILGPCPVATDLGGQGMISGPESNLLPPCCTEDKHGI